jgi:hypothetical protein
MDINTVKNFGILFLFVILGSSCAKDMDVEDFRREELQQKLSRISAVSGTYVGEVTSNLDQSNLGILKLNFQAATDVQNSNLGIDNEQRAIVSGSIQLEGLTSSELSFDNGHYDDVTGNFQVTIPVNDNGVAAKIYLSGHLTADQWIGTLEVNGQSSFGARLQLSRGGDPATFSSLNAQAMRFEHLRKLGLKYQGTYSYDGEALPFTLSFIDRSLYPAQRFFRLFSPVRTISVNAHFGDFELNFNQAVIDDKMGTLVASDPFDQRGNPARASLYCTKYEKSAADFGWDCDLQTRAVLLKIHASAVVPAANVVE